MRKSEMMKRFRVTGLKPPNCVKNKDAASVDTCGVYFVNCRLVSVEALPF